MILSRGSRGRVGRGRSNGDLELLDENGHDADVHFELVEGSHAVTDGSPVRHDQHEVRGQNVDQSHLVEPNLIQRLIAVMSLRPLLGRGSTANEATDYGALPVQAPERRPESLQSGDLTNISNDEWKRDRRKAAQASFSDSGHQQGRSKNFVNPRNRLRQRTFSGSSSILIAGPGHSAGLGGHLNGSITNVSGEDSVDEEEAISDDDDAEDPPDNSPYPQVRASVAAIDDTSLSINTPRMWVLSLLCAFLGSATNLFFSLRYPSVAITPVIALVVVHPLGRSWDKILKRPDDPSEDFAQGDKVVRTKSQAPISHQAIRTRLRLWLAQGKWNEKEHACVYISSNVSFGFAFATDVIVEQSKFYHQDPSIIYQILLTISTQILGYSFAGLTRRFLVRPPSMIWPGTLMSTAMFTTMHSSENKSADGWTITRWKFFLCVWSGAFAWYFLPGLLMPALSYFSVITWFAPKNVVVANLFGVHSGLGLLPVTFDWAQIAYIGLPLLTPFWAAANVVGGLVIVMWIIAPIMYYRNVLFSAFLPIVSASVFDDTGQPYDVSKILTPDYQFDPEAYSKYSKVYLPITYALSYGVQFASLSSLVTHTACWHGREILQQTSNLFNLKRRKNPQGYEPVDQGGTSDGTDHSATTKGTKQCTAESDMTASMSGEDIHCRLMDRYEDTPISWYLTTFLSMLAIGVFLVEYYPVYLPWYGLLLALLITAIFFIPVGIVMAITNQHSSLYLICQLICGVIFPGRPVANMIFTTYCYISSAQGVKFSSDLKLGHYMKIPPKVLFKVQMVATLVSSVTQIGVLNWMFSYIPNICTPEATSGFTCPLARVHFNGSVLWGVVGPKRFFGEGALYRNLVWGFGIGFVAPIIIWLVGRRRPSGSVWRKINLPVLFGSLSWIPPATGLNFSSWALVCFLFNSHLRRRAPAWWGKYTMTLSAALDSGLAFGVVIVFFLFLYPGWSWLEGLQVWWGARVFKEVS
ncbi:hypothetical protein ACLMJK_004321 [Lecanora helva]